MRIALSAAAIGAAWMLLLLRVAPVPTWFYVFAWYPTLVLIDATACKLDGRPSFFSNRARAVSMFAWSAVIWLVFEAANFRLENWYYVLLPRRGWERWTGILLSFATVVPAITLAERLLRGMGLFTRSRGRSVTVRPWDIRLAVALGVVSGALALLFPRVFFPLIWGALFLVADPLVYGRAPHLSLMRDMERGEWGRIGRLMVGGLGIGLLWETYNYWADGSWIYTVPWLEQLKLFEMPPLGFLGFPFFALEAWSMYAALCALGVAVPVMGDSLLGTGRRIAAGAGGALFAVIVLLGMETNTISSTEPRLADLPGFAGSRAAALRSSGIGTARELLTTDPDVLARGSPLNRREAGAAVDAARIVFLRGIGADHAGTLSRLGVTDVCTLARRDPDRLAGTVRTGSARPRPTAAEVRVWVRAARGACGDF